jgi:NADPH:quinone reductase-like Zn-dependent oxidoreductase
VIIKVYAAGINPIDVKRAAGALKLAMEDPWVYKLIIDPIGIDQVSFPYKIGYDCSGIITETGRDVEKFNIGDAVYVKLPEVSRGEYK